MSNSKLKFSGEGTYSENKVFNNSRFSNAIAILSAADVRRIISNVDPVIRTSINSRIMVEYPGSIVFTNSKCQRFPLERIVTSRRRRRTKPFFLDADRIVNN